MSSKLKFLLIPFLLALLCHAGLGLKITAVTPNSGSGAGGYQVLVTGSGFTSSTKVFFGSLQSPLVVRNSDTALTVLVPAYKDNYSVDVIVLDNIASDILANGFTYAVNNAPVFVSQPETLAYEESLYVYLVEVTDNENDPITLSLESNPQGMFLSGDTLLWRPPAYTVGIHYVILTARDNQNNQTKQIFSLQVLDTPNPPVFDSLFPAADTVINEGDTLVFRVKVSDPDLGDTIIYYWFMNGELAGSGESYTLMTDFTSGGVCSVKVLVFDGASQIQHIWAVTVNEVIVPPAILSPQKLEPVTGKTSFSWRAVPDPALDVATTRYRLEFALSSAFTSKLKVIDNLTASTYRLDELVDETELPEQYIIFVRVMAYDAYGAVTPFSDSTHGFLFLRYDGIEQGGNVLPREYSLAQNSPNPFHSGTALRIGIPFHQTRGANASIHIYDIKGVLVRALKRTFPGPGYHTILWDGKDSRHNACHAGIYLCRLETDGFTKTIKMTMEK
jgi:hypothetical protein